jgi:hypothetical protein
MFTPSQALKMFYLVERHLHEIQASRILARVIGLHGDLGYLLGIICDISLPIPGEFHFFQIHHQLLIEINISFRILLLGLLSICVKCCHSSNCIWRF